MATDVEGASFFHINSTSNGSPYSLMMPGDEIEIGSQTNPFFRYYETYARTYPVTEQDGSICMVPAMAFLRRVKDNSITPNDLPLTAWVTSRHFMMLARELVWENIRLAEFTNKPSRQTCLWLVETEEDARLWIQQTFGFHPTTHRVAKVRATGRALKVDSRFLVGDSEPLPVWYDKARRYWRGEMSDNLLPEILFTGTIRVEKIID